MKEITIQLTEKCNLNCEYCFADQKSQKCISEDDITFFISFCTKNKVNSIHITGGEPTLYNLFSKYTEKMSDIAYLVIYSNFTVNNTLKNTNLNNKDVIFLVNINNRDLYTEKQWTAIENNIENAKIQGVRIAFSYTFFRENFEKDFHYIVSLNKFYNIPLLRLSPAINNQNIDIKKLYRLIRDNYSILKSYGIKCYFDCPVPPCWIEKDVYLDLKKNLVIPSHCSPKIFIKQDLSISHCYVDNYKFNYKLYDFDNYETLLQCISNKVRPKYQLLEKCKYCEHLSHSLGCGCPIENSFKMRGN